MGYNDDGPSHPGGGRSLDAASLPMAIATILRGDGVTGVDTHIQQVCRYLEECGAGSVLVGAAAQAAGQAAAK